ADDDRAGQRFRELAARIAARGGRLDLDVGRVTRADIELHGAPRPTRIDRRSRAPGRTTRVAEEWERAAQEALAARSEQTQRPEQPAADASSPADAAADRAHGAPANAEGKRAPDENGREQTWRMPFESTLRFDAAELVERVRQSAQRQELPFQAELEEHFGQSLEFVEAFTGEVAAMACAALSATAFAVRNVVVLGDANPGRDVLVHELTHVIQSGGAGARAPRRFEPGSLAV